MSALRIYRQSELELVLEKLEGALFHMGVGLHKSGDAALFPVYHFMPGHQPTPDELQRLRREMDGQGTWICWLTHQFGHQVARIGVGFYLDDIGITDEHVKERLWQAAKELMRRSK